LDAVIKNKKKRALELLEKHLLHLDFRFKKFSAEHANLKNNHKVLKVRTLE
jgi:hypothetical protein